MTTLLLMTILLHLIETVRFSDKLSTMIFSGVARFWGALVHTFIGGPPTETNKYGRYHWTLERCAQVVTASYGTQGLRWIFHGKTFKSDTGRMAGTIAAACVQRGGHAVCQQRERHLQRGPTQGRPKASPATQNASQKSSREGKNKEVRGTKQNSRPIKQDFIFSQCLNCSTALNLVS